MVELLFLAVPRGFLQFVIVVFPDHTHLLFLSKENHRDCPNIVNFRHKIMTMRHHIHMSGQNVMHNAHTIKLPA